MILIVEDNEFQRRLFAKDLDFLGYKSVGLADGESAIERFLARDLGLILMDVYLPGIDGLEATRRIRGLEGEHAWPRIPIIGITARSSKSECLAAGMDDSYEKPVNIDQLRTIMQRWHWSKGRP